MFIFDKFVSILIKHSPFLIKLFLFLFIICLTAFSYFLINLNNFIDFQQGEVFKIIYIHISTSWFAILIYISITLFSILFLIYEKRIFIFFSLSLNWCGLLCTIISLYTGYIWGYYTWGTFWVMDPRIISVIFLCLLYITYFLINYLFNYSLKGFYYSSIISILGIFNIFIVKFSVEWWNTLHQSVSFNLLYNTIHISTFIPIILILFVLIWFLALIFLFYIRWFFLTNWINIYKYKLY